MGLVGQKCKKLGNKKKLNKPKPRRYNTKRAEEGERHLLRNKVRMRQFYGSSSDSDDPDYQWFKESDYEEESEDDCRQFQQNVDGEL